MKQLLLINGEPVVDEVPDPVVEAGCILVRTHYSGISSGTELAVMRAVSEPLWRRALKQPERVRQIGTRILREGFTNTFQMVQDRLASPVPLGYSAAGVVIGIGEGVDEFHIGDRVAVAGAQCAYHAELLCIPRNLAVHVPNDVSLDAASTVALGAIALQGVRRAEPTLGENIAVIGLGVLGQLTCQLLRANGCRVLAVDVDSARVTLATDLGADVGYIASPEAVDAVIRATDGMGVDAVIVTAATSSNEVMAQAFRMSRRKGRVVLVGDVGLDLQRGDMYTKELDFRVSCSYGPGRYDHRFEQQGVDYPFADVRWTETRNMAEYIRLLELGTVRIEPLLGVRFPLAMAKDAYAAIKESNGALTISLFDYGTERQAPVRILGVGEKSPRTLTNQRLGLAVVGAGSFFKAAHLPVLRNLASEIEIRAVVSRSGHNAKAIALQSGAAYASADLDAVLEDKEIDAVLISTRHNLHASLAQRALAAGKHVLVEKPLAIHPTELQILADYCHAHPDSPILHTGFNRRFSPFISRLSQVLTTRSGPLMINYRMNAGYIPADHWVHGPEGGGRNIGEACHIYDLMLALTSARAVRIEAISASPNTGYYRADDNFVATIRFSDGSIGNLIYTAFGNSKHPKEQMEVFCDGNVYVLDDYLELRRAGEQSPLMKSRLQNKGLAEQWAAFCSGIRDGIWPVPLETQIEATRISFEVQDALSK